MGRRRAAGEQRGNWVQTRKGRLTPGKDVGFDPNTKKRVCIRVPAGSSVLLRISVVTKWRKSQRDSGMMRDGSIRTAARNLFGASFTEDSFSLDPVGGVVWGRFKRTALLCA